MADHEWINFPDDPSDRVMHYVDTSAPDYDPWAGYEWPHRSGQTDRAPRKKAAPDSDPK